MAKKISKSTIDRVIRYFISNCVTFVDMESKFGIGGHTLKKYLNERGVKYDPQRTRRGKKAWNKGLTKHSDTRVAGFAKTLSESTYRGGKKDGYEKCIQMS